MAHVLPLQVFAKTLTGASKNRESKYSTISAYVEHLNVHRPQLIVDILAVSETSGNACLGSIEKAHASDSERPSGRYV